MEINVAIGPFASYAAANLREQDFVLFDIGCSGGIESVWRVFGGHLRAFAFDPNLLEVQRLNAAETSSKIRYEAGFVGIPDGHLLAQRRNGRAPLSRNPWGRLAVARTLKLMSEQISAASDEEKLRLNSWETTQLASSEPIFLPRYIEQQQVASIDFIKIDIDGNDFDVLCSLQDVLSSRSVLGICAEVNFFGSASPLDHTFHNTDRFLKDQGFELFALTTRNYPMSALAERYVQDKPGRSVSGRIFQGDALYLRDLCAPEFHEIAQAFGAEKLLKLAVLFSIVCLPDCAAEVLVTFKASLSHLIDVEHALDLLVQESSLGREKGWNYQHLMQEFEANSREIYST